MSVPLESFEAKMINSLVDPWVKNCHATGQLTAVGTTERGVVITTMYGGNNGGRLTKILVKIIDDEEESRL